MQLVECPSVYELIADYSFPWDTTPELRLVRAGGAEGEPVQRDSFGDLESVLAAMGKVLEKNTVSGTATACATTADCASSWVILRGRCVWSLCADHYGSHSVVAVCGYCVQVTMGHTVCSLCVVAVRSHCLEITMVLTVWLPCLVTACRSP